MSGESVWGSSLDLAPQQRRECSDLCPRGLGLPVCWGHDGAPRPLLDSGVSSPAPSLWASSAFCSLVLLWSKEGAERSKFNSRV